MSPHVEINRRVTVGDSVYNRVLQHIKNLESSPNPFYSFKKKKKLQIYSLSANKLYHLAFC